MNPSEVGCDIAWPAWQRGRTIMNLRMLVPMIGAAIAMAVVAGCSTGSAASVTWKQVLRQPAAWYSTPEAASVGEAVLSYQTPSGGWPKNWDMTHPLSDAFRALKESERAPTIDNGGTTIPIRLLARIHSAQEKVPAFREAVERGIDYLLAAQYASGGWPQFFPLRKGYYSHITFNDGAMVHAMEILRDVAAGRNEFDWIDAARRERARDAVARGVACILRCQVTIDGVKSAWCAQHDENTFAPAPARAFEPACLASAESVDILRFLMQEPAQTPELIAAVEAGVAWLEKVRIAGLRWQRIKAPGLPEGIDAVVVPDPAAPPLWARFYELHANRPIFIGRDGVVHFAVSEIEHERRIGYAWYVTSPAKLLEKDLPEWRGRRTTHLHR